MEIDDVHAAILDALSEGPHTNSYLHDHIDASQRDITNHIVALQLAGAIKKVEGTSPNQLVFDPREDDREIDDEIVENLTPLDHMILDLLSQGARTQGFFKSVLGDLPDDAPGRDGYSVNQIRRRLNALVGVGVVQPVEGGRGLYEVVNDPRPDDEIGATLDSLDVPEPDAPEEVDEKESLVPAAIKALDILHEGDRTVNYLAHETGHSRNTLHQHLHELADRGYVANLHESTSLWTLVNDPRPEDEIGNTRVKSDMDIEFERQRQKLVQTQRYKLLDLLMDGDRTLEYLIDALPDMDEWKVKNRLEPYLESGDVTVVSGDLEDEDSVPVLFHLENDPRPEDEQGGNLEADDGYEEPDMDDFDTEDPDLIDTDYEVLDAWRGDTTVYTIAPQFDRSLETLKKHARKLIRGGYLKPIHRPTWLLSPVKIPEMPGESERNMVLDVLHEGPRTSRYISAMLGDHVPYQRINSYLEEFVDDGIARRMFDEEPQGPYDVKRRFYELVDDPRPEDEWGTAFPDDAGYEETDSQPFDSEEMDPAEIDDTGWNILDMLSEGARTQRWMANELGFKTTVPVRDRLYEFERAGFVRCLHKRTGLYELVEMPDRPDSDENDTAEASA